MTRRTVEQFQGYAPFWTGYGFAFIYRIDDSELTTLPSRRHHSAGNMIHEHAKRVAALRPDFAHASLDGGTVYPKDEMPEQWTEAVRAFLMS